jgi:hypothetical protein
MTNRLREAINFNDGDEAFSRRPGRRTASNAPASSANGCRPRRVIWPEDRRWRMTDDEVKLAPRRRAGRRPRRVKAERGASDFLRQTFGSSFEATFFSVRE